MRWRNLRLVNRHNGRKSTNTQTSKDTPKDHHGHTSCEGLESTANDENDGSVKDGEATTEDITNTSHTQGRYESSNLEDSNHCTNLCSCRLVEVVFEVVAGDDPAHDTLVITEQENT